VITIHFKTKSTDNQFLFVPVIVDDAESTPGESRQLTRFRQDCIPEIEKHCQWMAKTGENLNELSYDQFQDAVMKMMIEFKNRLIKTANKADFELIDDATRKDEAGIYVVFHSIEDEDE
jgi:hypothetical protein